MRYTNATKINPVVAVVGGVFCGLFCGMVMIMFGLGLLLIPIIGWIVGPILMLFGLVAPIALPMSLLTEWSGTCPVCGAKMTINGVAATCKTCCRRIVRRDNRFIFIP